MTFSTLVMGGCRSGKSRYAQESAEQLAGPRIFVATCIPGDPEMQDRVAHHQAQRNAEWETVDAPVDLAGAVRSHPSAGVILIDCLTLWVANLMGDGYSDSAIAEAVAVLTHRVKHSPAPVILVSNEVGAGIVPENALARRYRDQTGWVNQTVAASVATVVWMVAGIPVIIKGQGMQP